MSVNIHITIIEFNVFYQILHNFFHFFFFFNDPPPPEIYPLSLPDALPICEVVAPERLMKRIIIVGMLVIVTLYVGANLAYLYMMPVAIMAQQKEAIARTVMTAIAGPAGGVLIMLAIMTSIFGALNGNLLAKPRVPYPMARDGPR